jgi:hypothetical protein
MGMMTLFGIPALPLVMLAGPTPSTALLVAVTALQLLLAVGAVALGLMSRSVGVPRRPASARAGIALGGLTLVLNTILAAVLTFNYVSNSMNPSVRETGAVILQHD